ncbi:MAG: alkaline phosphatase [Desulfurispora sp.]|uniref:alkaline phosphatase n=1 Tax=Desulfurispora sp. TaxID=3014275 RepID=UPI00404B3213
MRQNRTHHFLAILLVVMLLVSTGVSWAADNQTAAARPVKNVILLIPDGMSVAGTTLARWYQGGQPLALDEMACGLVRTYSADAPIADSAPAGTAYATGFKSHTGYVGVLPEANTMPGLKPLSAADKKRPVATVLEAARLAGKSTGLVVTCEIPHATPADFSAHYPNRSNYDDILEQQVYNGVDVVLGGGSKFLAPENRKDKEDLVKELKVLGYQYITKPAELQNIKQGKVWGLFAPKDLSYDFDRNPAEQPSLAEMTRKAIELISKDKDGFFLMVEGSKIDWASHANDPVGVIGDILAFDQAVKVALDFAKKDKQTVVIAVTDHGNGGISFGDRALSKTYDETPLDSFIAPLKKARLTGEGVEKKLNAERSNIGEVMASAYGITDLTAEEIEQIKNAKAGSLNYVVGPIISKRAHVGWTTNGHTGEDVVLYMYTPAGVPGLKGVVENTAIAQYMASVLKLDLARVTDRLFVEAKPALEKKGAMVTLDNSDAANIKLVARKGSNKLEIPVNKNYVLFNGKKIFLPGVNVYNGEKFFVARDAVESIK